MISQSQDVFLEIKGIISKEKKLIREIIRLADYGVGKNEEYKRVITSQIDSLKKLLNQKSGNLLKIVETLKVSKPLNNSKSLETRKTPPQKKRSSFVNKLKTLLKTSRERNFSHLERETIKRFGKNKKRTEIKKVKEPSKYIKFANKFFGDYSKTILKNDIFRNLNRNLIKSNLQFVPKTYISIILLTFFLSLILSFMLSGFFLFLNIGPKLPIITLVTESFSSRFLKIFWIPLVIPILTAILVYYYPNMEKRLHENKINDELPFATIHMSAISGSMIDPTKIFSIIISTEEYPYVSKEFTKLLNQINIYGHDIVGALRNLSFTTANPKLSELFNGLSTTINSGGDLAGFFEKRAESLLFDYKIEREKRTKSAETFMDIYISIVIAAPMIFMLLLMMMKISGLGIALSSNMISLVMVVGVAIINIGFLVFLQLKQPTK